MIPPAGFQSDRLRRRETVFLPRKESCYNGRRLSRSPRRGPRRADRPGPRRCAARTGPGIANEYLSANTNTNEQWCSTGALTKADYLDRSAFSFGNRVVFCTRVPLISPLLLFLHVRSAQRGNNQIEKIMGGIFTEIPPTRFWTLFRKFLPP